MASSSASSRTILTALALALIALSGAALAYENESPAAPRDGEPVGDEVKFYIYAEGSPEPEVYYQIEVAEDDDFEVIVARFDSRSSTKGWSFGDSYMLELENVPDEYMPTNYEGIHFKARGRFRSGTYFWRASRARGGGAFEPLDGEESFRVDTVPPGPVDTLMLAIEDGQLVLYWDPVMTDENDDYETVAGYRVYQYTRLLKRYPLMTRYLVSETETTETALPGFLEEMHRIVFFRVGSVDEVGNEAGRRRPARIGSFEAQFNPPNLDELASPDHLRQKASEYDF